jgi:hypothetical protein
MDQIMPPELNDLELEALRRLAVHPGTSFIPYRIHARLRDIGYTRDILGSIVLTEDGWQRVAMSKGRTSTAHPA